MMFALNDFTLSAARAVIWDLPKDELEQIRLFGVPAGTDLALMSQALPGPKWAFYAGELPLVVGGYIPNRTGVYASWFLATVAAWDFYGKDVTEMTRARIEFMLSNGAHRIETVCLAKRKLAQRWYRHLGLHLESIMTGFCIDGSDAAMYVTTRAP